MVNDNARGRICRSICIGYTMGRWNYLRWLMTTHEGGYVGNTMGRWHILEIVEVVNDNAYVHV